MLFLRPTSSSFLPRSPAAYRLATEDQRRLRRVCDAREEILVVEGLLERGGVGGGEEGW